MCNLCCLKHYLRHRPPVLPQEVPEGVEELDVGLDRPVAGLPDDVARAAGELGHGVVECHGEALVVGDEDGGDLDVVILDVLVDGLLVADGERVAGAAARKFERESNPLLTVLNGYDDTLPYYETIPQYDSCGNSKRDLHIREIHPLI